jgi:hypothetical protein
MLIPPARPWGGGRGLQQHNAPHAGQAGQCGGQKKSGRERDVACLCVYDMLVTIEGSGARVTRHATRHAPRAMAARSSRGPNLGGELTSEMGWTEWASTESGMGRGREAYDEGEDAGEGEEVERRGENRSGGGVELRRRGKRARRSCLAGVD